VEACAQEGDVRVDALGERVGRPSMLACDAGAMIDGSSNGLDETK
jgi:hypothetical protein